MVVFVLCPITDWKIVQPRDWKFYNICDEQLVYIFECHGGDDASGSFLRDADSVLINVLFISRGIENNIVYLVVFGFFKIHVH